MEEEEAKQSVLRERSRARTGAVLPARACLAREHACACTVFTHLEKSFFKVFFVDGELSNVVSFVILLIFFQPEGDCEGKRAGPAGTGQPRIETRGGRNSIKTRFAAAEANGIRTKNACCYAP